MILNNARDIRKGDTSMRAAFVGDTLVWPSFYLGMFTPAVEINEGDDVTELIPRMGATSISSFEITSRTEQVVAIYPSGFELSDTYGFYCETLNMDLSWYVTTLNVTINGINYKASIVKPKVPISPSKYGFKLK